MSRARVATWAAAAVVGAIGVGLAVPVLAGLFPVAQLVSFRAVLGLAGIAGALALLAVPPLRRRAMPVVVALALGAAVQGAVLVSRAVPHGPPTTTAAGTTTTPDDVVVLSFNTLDVVPPGTLAELVEKTDADVVVLAETSPATVRATAAALAEAGRPVQVHTSDADHRWIAGTGLLVARTLGDYPTATRLPLHFGGVRSVPTDGAGPTLVAAHPMSPGGRSAMPTWRSETAWVAQACASTPGAIVAGDLNATLDHPGLRDLGPCVDAARAAGEAWRGTWPSSAPSLLAAPIDHVLVDGRAWRVTGFDVLGRTGGSDHRPVVAHLVRR